MSDFDFGTDDFDTGDLDTDELDIHETNGDGLADVGFGTGIDEDPMLGSHDAAPDFGTPERWIDDWHEQEQPNSCAVASQEFILEEITGRDFAERDLANLAEANGWYTPDGGTPVNDVGRILEAHGIPVDRSWGNDLGDLAAALAEGEGVIVGLDSGEITIPGYYGLPEDLLHDAPGIPGQGVDHAVQVIGVRDYGTPDATVIINDPGHPGGAGVEIPADQFSAAWADGGNFAAITNTVGDASPFSLASLGSGQAWASSDGFSYIDGVAVDRHGTNGGYYH